MAGVVESDAPLFSGWNALYNAQPNTQNGIMQKYSIAQKAFGGNSFSIKNTAPICFRKLLETQLSHSTTQRQAKEKEDGFNPLGDNRSIRIKAFFAATLGAAFSAVYRIVRIAIWTCFLPLTTIHHIGKASRYGIANNVKEHFRRYAHEWVDLGVTVSCSLMGLCKTIKPDAFKNTTHALATYYFTRFDSRNRFDKGVNDRIAEYDDNKRKAETMRNAPMVA